MEMDSQEVVSVNMIIKNSTYLCVTFSFVAR